MGIKINDSLLTSFTDVSYNFFNIIPKCTKIERDNENSPVPLKKDNLIVKWLQKYRETTFTLASEVVDSYGTPKINSLRLNDWSDFNTTLKEFMVREYNSLTRYDPEFKRWETFVVDNYYSTKIPYLIKPFLQNKGTRSDLHFILTKTGYTPVIGDKNFKFFSYNERNLDQVRQDNKCTLSVTLAADLVDDDLEKYSGYPGFLKDMSEEELHAPMEDIMTVLKDKLNRFDRSFLGLISVRFSTCFLSTMLVGMLKRKEYVQRLTYDPNDHILEFTNIKDPELRKKYLDTCYGIDDWRGYTDLKKDKYSVTDVKEYGTYYSDIFGYLHYFNEEDADGYKWFVCDEAMMGVKFDELNRVTSNIACLDGDGKSISKIFPYDIPKTDEAIEGIPEWRYYMTVNGIRLIWTNSRYHVVDDISISGYLFEQKDPYKFFPQVHLLKSSKTKIDGSEQLIIRQNTSPASPYYFDEENIIHSSYFIFLDTQYSNVVDNIIVGEAKYEEQDDGTLVELPYEAPYFYSELQDDILDEEGNILIRRVCTDLKPEISGLKRPHREKMSYKTLKDTNPKVNYSGVDNSLILQTLTDLDDQLTLEQVTRIADRVSPDLERISYDPLKLSYYMMRDKILRAGMKSSEFFTYLNIQDPLLNILNNYFTKGTEFIYDPNANIRNNILSPLVTPILDSYLGLFHGDNGSISILSSRQGENLYAGRVFSYASNKIFSSRCTVVVISAYNDDNTIGDELASFIFVDEDINRVYTELENSQVISKIPSYHPVNTISLIQNPCGSNNTMLSSISGILFSKNINRASVALSEILPIFNGITEDDILRISTVYKKMEITIGSGYNFVASRKPNGRLNFNLSKSGYSKDYFVDCLVEEQNIFIIDVIDKTTNSVLDRILYVDKFSSYDTTNNQVNLQYPSAVIMDDNDSVYNIPSLSSINQTNYKYQNKTIIIEVKALLPDKQETEKFSYAPLLSWGTVDLTPMTLLKLHFAFYDYKFAIDTTVSDQMKTIIRDAYTDIIINGN